MWSLWLASFTENILGFTHILKCISTSLFDAVKRRLRDCSNNFGLEVFPNAFTLRLPHIHYEAPVGLSWTYTRKSPCCFMVTSSNEFAVCVID